MKQHSTRWHIGLAILLLILPFFLYTALSRYLPHPEDISPFFYFASALFGFWSLVKLRGTHSFWGYIWVPLLALFGLLEEISYGMELGWYQPFTVGSPDLLFQDFHNFVHIFWRWIEAQLGLGTWNSAVFLSFLWPNIAILVLCLLWVVAFRYASAALTVKQRHARVFHLASISAAVISLICIVWLFALPADPKNAVFLGLSLARLAEVFLLVAFGLIALGLEILSRSPQKPSLIDRLDKLIQLGRRSLVLSIFLWLALLAGLLYGIFASFTLSPEEIVFLARIAPLVAWLIAQSALFLLALACWHGRLRQSLSTYAHHTYAYFEARPPLVYTLFAIALLVVAEALDRDYFFLPNTSSQMTGMLARDWHIWAEETFELIAAIHLGAASFFFPKLAK